MRLVVRLYSRDVLECVPVVFHLPNKTVLPSFFVALHISPITHTTRRTDEHPKPKEKSVDLKTEKLAQRKIIRVKGTLYGKDDGEEKRESVHL